jgi:hypothetical protein
MCSIFEHRPSGILPANGKVSEGVKSFQIDSSCSTKPAESSRDDAPCTLVFGSLHRRTGNDASPLVGTNSDTLSMIQLVADPKERPRCSGYPPPPSLASSSPSPSLPRRQPAMRNPKPRMPPLEKAKVDSSAVSAQQPQNIVKMRKLTLNSMDNPTAQTGLTLPTPGKSRPKKENSEASKARSLSIAL